jgi:hypothetical protein
MKIEHDKDKRKSDEKSRGEIEDVYAHIRATMKMIILPVMVLSGRIVAMALQVCPDGCRILVR